MQILSSAPGTIPSSAVPRLTDPLSELDRAVATRSPGKKASRPAFAVPLPKRTSRPTPQPRRVSFHQDNADNASPYHGSVNDASAVAAAVAAGDVPLHGNAAAIQYTGPPAIGTDPSQHAAVLDSGNLDPHAEEQPLHEARGQLCQPEGAAAAGAEAGAAADSAGSHASEAGQQDEMDIDESGDLEEDDIMSMQLRSDESSSDEDNSEGSIGRAPPWRLDQIPRMDGSLLKWLPSCNDVPGLASAQVISAP